MQTIVESLESRRLLSTVVFSGNQDFEVSIFATSLATADVDLDGNADLLSASDSANSHLDVLIGNGDGTFRPKQSYAVGNLVHGVSTGLLNNDPFPDAIVSNSDDNNVGVLLNNGAGTFLPQQTFATGGDPSFIDVADFNRDGRLDLAVTNEDDSTVSVLLGKGDGTFLPQKTFAVGFDPLWVASGDFNRDGKLDLVATSRDDNSVSVLLGNGKGSFAAQQVLDVGNDPWSVLVSDFNLDGKLDIATANHFGDSVSVLLGNGKGAFLAAKDYLTGLNPTSISVADMNDDGIDDLITANNQANSVTVLIGQGDGTFHSPRTFAVGDTPYMTVTADFNGDTHPDIAAMDYFDGAVRILINQPLLRAPKLITPNNSTGVSLEPTLSWTAVPGTVGYRVLVGTDLNSLPTDPSASAGVSGAVFDSTDDVPPPFTLDTHLRPGTKYYWEVQGQRENIFGTQYGSWSGVASFTTAPNTAPAIKKIADVSVGVTQNLSFSSAFSDPDLIDGWIGTIDWGDGTGRHTLALHSDKKFLLAHTFTKTGTFLASVVVKDRYGGSSLRQFHVTVHLLEE
jgi:hypothetical protein